MKPKYSLLNDAPRPPRGFATLARRISTYTSRAVLSAVVLIAGLGFGRQVLQWWRDDAVDLHLQAPAVAPGLGHPSAAHEVVVGDRPWSIVRQTFQGDAAAASRALLAACQTAAGETAGMRLPAPSSEERALLARLADSEPELHAPAGVSLYSLTDGFPLVVGTRSGGPAGQPDAGAQPEGSDPAVATWGIAVPTNRASWGLYTFRPEERCDDSDRERLQPPLPTGCRALLHVRTVNGDTSMVFTGPLQPEAGKASFDRWAAEAGLRSGYGWRESGGAWHVTYRSTAANSPAVVDIHFQQTQPGHARGLILVGP